MNSRSSHRSLLSLLAFSFSFPVTALKADDATTAPAANAAPIAAAPSEGSAPSSTPSAATPNPSATPSVAPDSTTPAAPAAETPRPATYTVVSGDTLWDISRKFDTSIRKLKKLNNLKKNNLKPGQVLKIPPATK
jgi:5'-nucleotidase/UDP-sugar diphosphatase